MVGLGLGWTEEAETPGRRQCGRPRETGEGSALGGNRGVPGKRTDQDTFWNCSQQDWLMRRGRDEEAWRGKSRILALNPWEEERTDS